MTTNCRVPSDLVDFVVKDNASATIAMPLFRLTIRPNLAKIFDEKRLVKVTALRLRRQVLVNQPKMRVIFVDSRLITAVRGGRNCSLEVVSSATVGRREPAVVTSAQVKHRCLTPRHDLAVIDVDIPACEVYRGQGKRPTTSTRTRSATTSVDRKGGTERLIKLVDRGVTVTTRLC